VHDGCGARRRVRVVQFGRTRLEGWKRCVENPMTVFTFHFAETTIGTAVRALCFPPTGRQIPGLTHAECMTRMTPGAPILSPARMQLRHLTMFAAWESPAAGDEFLADTWLGRALASGWHVRMRHGRPHNRPHP
jgi:hypothetical protein